MAAQFKSVVSAGVPAAAAAAAGLARGRTRSKAHLLLRAWKWYESMLDRRPVLTKGSTAFIIFGVSDCVRQAYEAQQAQTQTQPSLLTTAGESGKDSRGKEMQVNELPLSSTVPMSREAEASASASWDAVRSFRMAAWYGCVHAPIVHGWYGLLERWLGAGTSLRLVATKVALDQSLLMPPIIFGFLYFQALARDEQHRPAQAWAVTRESYIPTVLGTLACWVPAQSISFRFVPLRYRLLFVNVVQLGFGVFLSKMANQPAAAERSA